jgi:hypothetical protein
MTLTEQWAEKGKEWMECKISVEEYNFGLKNIKLGDKQKAFVNSKKPFSLYSGGFGCGKSMALWIRMIMLCLFFPNNLVLLGKRYVGDIEKNILPDLFDLIPQKWIKYRIKDGTITFFNGSQILLFGLDAMQSGNVSDIKKAEQKIKGLNLGHYFIDQLEEVEQPVFDALNARLRRLECPIRGGSMDTNPANFWAYEVFKVNPLKREDIFLVEGSMLDNKANLPEDYLAQQMAMDETYVRRFVHGEWSKDVLTKSCVFAQEHIRALEALTVVPLKDVEGIKIYQERNTSHSYQIGVDPSDGSTDPCHISCVDLNNTRKVASFSGFLPADQVAEKTLLMAKLYTTATEPLIIPEINASCGGALLENIKKRYSRIYEREVFDLREQRKINKLGWQTNRATKGVLINKFLELLRLGIVNIPDKETVEEMKTFVWTDEARMQGAGAQNNYHDDKIMATMLSYYGVEKKDTNEEATLANYIRSNREKVLREKYI